MKNLKGSDLKFGDIIFIDERTKWNIIGRAIRVLQNNGKHPDNFFMPNHNGIVFEENEDLHKVKIIQSALAGVKVVVLGYWTKQKTTNIVAKRYRGYFPDYKKAQMKVWLKHKIGLPYDFLSFIPILIKYFVLKMIENPIFRKIIKHLPNPLDSKTRIICSELIWRAWLEILAIMVWVSIHPSYISPWDEYRSKKFRTMGRYYNFPYVKE